MPEGLLTVAGAVGVTLSVTGVLANWLLLRSDAVIDACGFCEGRTAGVGGFAKVA